MSDFHDEISKMVVGIQSRQHRRIERVVSCIPEEMRSRVTLVYTRGCYGPPEIRIE